MKEKTIVMLAIVLAIFTMLLIACTGVASAKTYPSVDGALCVASTGANSGETVADELLTSAGL